MKRPQGVYLPEATHHNLATLAANSLDNRGSLAGFFEFLGEGLAAFKELHEGAFNEGNDEALKDYLAEAREFNWYERNEEDHHKAWGRVVSLLPWHQHDPSMSHLFSLYALQETPIWANEQRPTRHNPKDSLIQKLVIELRQAARNAKEKRTPIWKRNKLEIILSANEPSHTSFYLETDHHHRTTNLFGTAFYSRIERGLHRTLSLTENWSPVEVEIEYLEHGNALLAYEPILMDLGDLKKLSEDADEWAKVYRREEGLSRVAATIKAERRTERGFSWELVSEVSDFLFRYALSTSFRLYHQLGLYVWGGNFSDLAEETEPRFRELYRVPTLLPEHSLAFSVIKNSEYSNLDQKTGMTANAVDWHVAQLFMLYAASVLSAEDVQQGRASIPALATLAQPWVFKTKNTLAAYASANVSKDIHGTWRIKKSRKVVLELSDQQAYQARKALNAVFPVLPMTTPTPGEIKREFVLNPAEGLCLKAWETALKENWETERVTIPLGPDVIDRTLILLNEHEEPVLAGVHLIAELTDNTLEAQGKFAHSFLEKAHKAMHGGDA